MSSYGFPGAGALRQLISIQMPGPLDGHGNPIPEWQTEYSSISAKVEELGGGKLGPDRFWDPRAGNTQMIPTETHRVTVRYISTLDGTRRIVFGTKILDIISVSDFESRHIYMIVMCRERVGVTS